MRRSSDWNLSGILEILTYEDLVYKVKIMQKHINTLSGALRVQECHTKAANAHCTKPKCAISDLQTQLDNIKKQKVQKSVKVKAWFLTLPELKDTFEAEEAEC